MQQEISYAQRSMLHSYNKTNKMP